MPTNHPKVLITMTERQRDQLRAAADQRSVTVSQLVRDALINDEIIEPDPELNEYGGLRQIWTRDDDTAQITSTPTGYHVDLTIDDWTRDHHDFLTLEDAQQFLRANRFKR